MVLLLLLLKFLWIVFVMLTLIQVIASDNNSNLEEKFEDPPLTKSLGYAIRKRIGSSSLDDAKMNREYMYQYNDMLKASQEAFENFARKDDRRLRRVVGEYNYEMMKEAGVLDRRRNTRVLESAVGQRRVRTQAVRRQKLNSQSLKSHLLHSKQSGGDDTPDS